MLKQKVQDALDEIRPALQADGGDIKLIEIHEDEKIIDVKLTGACSGCPMAAMTLKQGVEAKIKEVIPEIKEVRSV